jgi:uncharacterized protein YozE (UPF0346 family)
MNKADSPIILTHRLSKMSVLDELSFPKTSDFTREDIQEYIDRYVSFYNRSAVFEIEEYEKSVKFLVTRVK